MDIFSSIRNAGSLAIASKYGCKIVNNTFSPCPACGATTRHTKRKDPRLACIAVKAGQGWLCLQCGAKGDSVDLFARFNNGGNRPKDSTSWRLVLRAWEQGGAIHPLPDPAASFLGQARGLPGPPGSLARPPFSEVMALWERSVVEPSKEVLPFLKEKFPAYTPSDLVDLDTARWLPQKDLPEWWPWRYPFLACLAFDSHGLVQSIHARVAGPVQPGKPKSRFPRGYAASGLVLANKTAVGWLRGKREVSTVVIAEGLTSTLACAMALRKIGKWDYGVLGYVSGSHSAIKEMPWAKEEVLIFTDNDSTGQDYATRIMSSLPPTINPRRVTL